MLKATVSEKVKQNHIRYDRYAQTTSISFSYFITPQLTINSPRGFNEVKMVQTLHFSRGNRVHCGYIPIIARGSFARVDLKPSMVVPPI